MEKSVKEVKEVKLESKRGRKPTPSRVVVTKEVYRDWKPWSWKYVWPDRIAMKHKLTEKQKAFVDEFLLTNNQSAAYRASKWTLNNPEEWTDGDRCNGSMMRRHEKIKAYLQEKILTDAEKCLDIQMDLIENEKTPAAVRNAAIIDRLNRAWVGKEKQESNEFTGIGEVTITIKHKQPDIIDMDNTVNDVEILDWENENGKTIQSELWDDWEASWSMGEADWHED